MPHRILASSIIHSLPWPLIVDSILNPRLINISRPIQGSLLRNSLRTKRGDYFTFCIAQKVTMVRPALAQPCATAHQPNLVALKTRYDSFTIA